ncbi:MAG: hypothetical protein GY751_22550 [Bacteroidetes bacterium]|nr:hypothetical protein [Bacteroidota bacterium]
MITSSNTQRRRNQPANSLIAFLVFMCAAFVMNAQNINISSVVRPPYGFDIEEYAYNMTVILTATGETPDVGLRVQIKGANGVELVSSPGFSPFSLFELFPGTPYMVTGSELEEYFDLDNLMINGISRQILEEQGLPEGRYQICLSVDDDHGNSGCSNYFQLSAIDPPRIISPVCGSKILNTQSQNIVFTWSNPPGSPPNITNYTLRIVEMANPNLSAEEALSSNAIPFFEEEIQGRTSFFYGPAQPFLEKGKKYAFEVVAENLELMLRFENNGRSEACWFQFGDAFAFEFDPPDFVEEDDPTIQPAGDGILGLDESVEPAPWLNYSITTISGRLYYFYQDPVYYTGTSHNNSTGFPLANMPVKFVVKYYMLNPSWNDTRPHFLMNTELGDITEYLTISNNLVLGSTVTDEGGNFFLPFNLTEPMGKLGDLVQLGHYETGLRGDLYRAVFAEVQDPHYLQPTKALVVQPNESNDVGIVKTKVRAYELNVQLESSVDPLLAYQANVLNDIEVSLIRTSSPALVPPNEVIPGENNGPEGIFGWEVVGKEISENGKLKFKWVVYNTGGNDRYFIKAQSAESADHDWYYPMTVYTYSEHDYKSDNVENYNPASSPYQNNAYNPAYEYNYDVELQRRDITLSVIPRDPLVYGIVKDHRGKGVHGAKVKLLMNDIKKEVIREEVEDNSIWGDIFGQTTTEYTTTVIDVPDMKWVGEDDSESDGAYSIRFKADHKRTEKPGNPWHLAPFGLFTTKSGYKLNYRPVNTVGNAVSLILMGKRYSGRDINLNPSGQLNGKITSESKQAVRSRVYLLNSEGIQITDDPYTTQKMTTRDINTGVMNVPEFAEFELKVPSGDHYLVVDPVSPHYFDDTVEIRIKSGNNSIVYTAQEKAHRVEVRVMNAKYKGMMYNSMDPPDDLFVPYANVTILDRNVQMTTNNKGLARLKPFRGGNTYKIHVDGPGNMDYESADVDVYDGHVSREYKKITVWLKPAARISGQVSVEGRTSFNLPLDSAVVRLTGAGGYDVSTTTDSDGKYVLRNVPLGNGISISASKPGSNFIGQTMVLDITTSGLSDVNFVLEKPATIDLSSLWGFDLAVDEATQDNGSWIISGSIGGFVENNGLSADLEFLLFTDLEVRPKSSTDMTAVPVSSSVSLEKNDWVLTYDPSLKLVQVNKQQGLVLTEINDGIGAVHGKIYIDASNSFDDPELEFKDTLYLTQGGLPGKIASISASGSSWNTGTIILKDQNGGVIDLDWNGYGVTSTTSGGKINGDRVEWDAVLHTDLQNVQPADLEIDIGKFRIAKHGVDPIASDQPISLKLDEWDLISTDWWIINSELQLRNGTLKTHVVDVPFQNMSIKPTQLQYGTYQVDQLTLNGVLNLDVNGNANLFREEPLWKLSVMPNAANQPAAHVRALPAMDRDLAITDIALYSDRTGSLNVKNDQVILHGIAEFTPDEIIADDNRVKIPGFLDFGIPEFPLQTTAVVYKRNGNNLQFGLQAFPVQVYSNGVQLDFDVVENSLSPSGVYLDGTISEPGLYSMNAKLDHNNSRSVITLKDDNEFRLGKSGNQKLTAITGGMESTATAWQPFHFAGDLTNTNGMTGRLEFRVVGDVQANDQAIEVKNMDTPFGSLSVGYDFDKGELSGTIEKFDKQIGSSGRMAGTAKFVAGSTGWFFCGGAILQIPTNPYLKEASMAMVFGDYPVGTDPYVKSTFETFAYEGKLPSQFSSNLKGFFIDGAAVFPAPYVPDIDVDLVVVSGELWVRIGGDFNLGMNFADGPGYFSTGSEIYVHGHIGVSGSVGIACAGASLDARVTYTALGEYWTNGNWGVDASGSLKLGGSAYAGGGCCNSSCRKPKYSPVDCCFKSSWSGSKTFGVRFHMGSDANYFNVDF